LVLAGLVVLFGCASADWVQVWNEEFDGTGMPDDGRWNYEEGCSGWGNNELECYTVRRSENARVEDGHLTINVKVEPWADKQYTSARMTSKQSWTYGKFEARAKLPYGKHLWPAIWMMPARSVYGTWAASGEIDIMEYRGLKSHTTQGTIHYGGTWPNNRWSGSGEKDFNINFDQDYHTFAIEWSQTEFKWFVDGQHFHTENIDRSMWSGSGNNPYTKNGQPFDQEFFWILNIAVGGNFFPRDQYGDLTVDEARRWEKPTMEIDYLRVFQWQ